MKEDLIIHVKEKRKESWIYKSLSIYYMTNAPDLAIKVVLILSFYCIESETQNFYENNEVLDVIINLVLG